MKKLLFFVTAALLSLSAAFAQSGKYLELDGVNRYMRIPHHADFNFSTSEEFSISFWINANAYVTNARMVAKRGASSAADKSGYEVWGTNSAGNFFALNTPNPAGTNLFSAWGTVPGSTGNWIHIAFVVSRAGGKSVVYQYQNGQLAKSSEQASKDVTAYEVTNTFDILVGKTDYVSVGYLNANIDNLRFWKKGLTAAEVEADKTATVTAETPGLVAAYDFETATATTVADIKGTHPATLVNFPPPGNITITAATVTKDNNFSGRGNDNEEIIKTIFSTTGSTATDIKNMVINMGATTDINDVEEIKIYTTGAIDKFDPRTTAGKTLIATATPAAGDITVTTTGQLKSGQNVLWITYKVKETAKEGNKLDASFLSITTDNETYTLVAPGTAGTREILLRRTLVLAPGDYGSANYRIPAIITAADGALVTLTDKRKNNSADLPQDIDIVARRSTDNGKTWSDPVTVALGTGYGKGFGDACVMKSNTGKLVALFVGGNQFQASTADNPIRSYMSISADNGLTWTPPRDLTNDLYGSGCTDPVRKLWQGSFFGSGRGLCTKAGRLMAVMTVKPQSGSYKNYAIYSDDEGATWQVSNLAIDGGDEAKVMQLNNGDILMSSRTSGNRLWAKSTDNGINWGAKNSWSEIWGNACDADIVRYTSTLDNFDKNRILHTLPNATDRRNVTMWISYDEATTWPVKKTICPNTSAYSAITILPDGTIGVYLEENESVPYKMYFLNFSLDWLTNGADSYTPPGTPIVEQPVISLPAGRYAPPQNVTITCPTAGATIYYTLDGSTPNKNATPYTGAITLDNSCTLKTLAVKEGMANSIIAAAAYTIGYVIPPQARTVGADRYLTAAKTTDGLTNINYTASAAPASHYIYYNTEKIETKQGDTFTLNLTALPGQPDGLQFCQVIILADWNRDYDFADTGERIAIIGNRGQDNSATTMNIAKQIAVPAAAALGKTRMRVVYTDAWRPTAYADLGDDPVDKGRCYDFDLEVNKGSGTNDFLATKVTVSPNPVTDFANIQLPGAGNYKISLVSVDGKTLETIRIETAHPELYTMNLTHHQPAVYLLKIKQKNGFEKSLKILKKGK